MGIKNLQKFLEHHLSNDNCIKTIDVSLLADKVIAIDVSIFLYKYICAIRKTSTDIYSIDGQVITHVHGTLTKVFGLIKNKIKPIFVFDGKPPDMKQHVLTDRTDKKIIANTEANKIRKHLSLLSKHLKTSPETIEEVNELMKHFEKYTVLQKELKKSLRASTGISYQQSKDCKKLLKLMGMPYFVADGEADPFCAELVKSGIAYATSTEDMDLITFGSTRVIRGLKTSGSCKLYDLDLILKDLNITYEQFVDVCILLGCDYTCTIKGLGLKSILNEIKTHGNIEGIIRTKNWKVSKDFNYVGAREQFFSQKEIPIECVWSKPDYVGLEKFLKTKFAYNDDEIGKFTNTLRGGYYSVICGEKTPDQYKKDYKTYVHHQRAEISMDSDED